MLVLTTAIVATLIAGGCSHESSVSAPASESQRYRLARPVAERWIQLLAAHRTGAALEAPTGEASRRSLNELAAWLNRLPLSQLRVVASDVPVRDRNASGVLLTLTGRLGRAPSSIWLDMGQRALEVRDTGNGWKVADDISAGAGITVVRSGLGAIPSARYVLGNDSVVVDASDRDPAGAASAAAVADRAVPYLRTRYPDRVAMERPVIFLVPDWPTAQSVANAVFPHELLGVDWRDLVYIDDAAWQSEPVAYQGAAIVHELTHVATTGIVRGTPESMVEGIARYEEAAYLRRSGARLPLGTLVAAYRRGYPSLHRWTQRLEPVWGLSNQSAIALAYDDGFAVVQAVIDRHGGVAALRRLGAAFRRRASGGDFTPADVGAVFRSALGVSFEQVVREAHGFARESG